MTQRHTPHAHHRDGGDADHGGHGHGGHRTHKFDPAKLERLLGDQRWRLLPPDDTLRVAGIAPGQTVVDLGCGPGYFTLPAAALAGSSGRSYAVDIQQELLDICRRRTEEAGLSNVETVHSEESHVPLPDACADRVFAAFVLHETDDPAAFLRVPARSCARRRACSSRAARWCSSSGRSGTGLPDRRPSTGCRWTRRWATPAMRGCAPPSTGT